MKKKITTSTPNTRRAMATSAFSIDVQLGAGDTLSPSGDAFAAVSSMYAPKIKLTAAAAPAPDASAPDMIAVLVREDDIHKTETPLSGSTLSTIDESMQGLLSEAVGLADFTGSVASLASARTPPSGFTGAKHVALVGTGKDSTTSASAVAMYKVGMATAKEAKRVRVKSLEVRFHEGVCTSASALAGFARGLVVGGYDDSRFKSSSGEEAREKKRSKLESVCVVIAPQDQMELPAVEAALKHGAGSANGVLLAKQLVGAPANVVTPTALAHTAMAIAASNSSTMKATILEKDDCEKLGMGLYLGVSACASEPPKFIHLVYTPPGVDAAAAEALPQVGIVGKGLTFDSGGYNIKAGAGSMIDMMKFDMGGSAATLGAAAAVAALEPEGVCAHFIVASCENMVSSVGMRPGDILKASNGKTVEVNNTDAEGRLTLADALVYAQTKAKVETVIDIATLTGACMVALGPHVAGMYSSTDAMAAAVAKSAEDAGEKMWRMPLEQGYFEQLKSSYADMKNTGTRYGGSITAALFLKEFINEGVSWAHVDMAGPVWDSKADCASGYGAATLADFVCSYPASRKDLGKE